MKYIIYSFILTVFFTSSISCKKDFLNDVNNGSILLRQEYVADLKTTNDYLNGIYTSLGFYLYAGYQVIYPDLIADNIKPVLASSGTTPLLLLYNWEQKADETNGSSGATITAASPNCNGASYYSYQIIRACSFVLEKANEYRDQDPVKADLLKGQAHAIRALTYFTLVNMFAQPYSFKADASHPGVVVTTSSNWTEPVSRRNTVQEVYNLLISDLNNAISLLPAGTASSLAMNRNAARALLARVYLFKGDYTASKNMAAQVVRDVPMMIANYPSRLFTPTETEALFQIPPGVFAVNGYNTTFANFFFRSRIQFQATADVATLLTENPNDLRKSWVSAAAGNWNITKYPSGATQDPTPDKANAYYQTVIRSSEMYLTAAECYANLNNQDSALYYLNAIQKRANVSLTGNAVTGAALLDSIYKERRKELAFEGLRMFDLLRWKKGVARADALGSTAKNLPFPSNKAISPIPQLDVTVLGLSQNDDY